MFVRNKEKVRLQKEKNEGRKPDFPPFMTKTISRQIISALPSED